MTPSLEPQEGNRWKRLGDMLLDAGLITAGQLSEGLAEKDRLKCFLGQALVKLGYVSQDELISFLVKQCKIPHINLADYKIDPRIVGLLPNELCLQYKLIPIDQLGSILTIGMVNPLDIEALDQARLACPDLKIKPILCTPEHFELAANQYLVTDASASSASSTPLSMESLGLRSNMGPPVKSGGAASERAGKKNELASPEKPTTTVSDDYARLVREILAELLDTFQGPLRGQLESSSTLLTSPSQRDTEFSFTIDTSGAVCYVSPSVTAVTGYVPEEFQARFPDILTAPPGNTSLRQTLALALSGTQRPPVEARLANVDGMQRTLVVALIPVFDSNGTLVAVQAIARDISDRAAAEQSLYLAATHDSLTGLLNLRSFLSRIEETTMLAQRHGTPASIAVVNVDNFTRVNEAHGKDEGDAVLQQVGQIMRRTLRGEDFVAYAGGDEFCILMPHVSPDSARNAIGRYIDALTGAQFVSATGQPISLSVTVGFSSITKAEQSPAELLEAARACVRRGKVAGGNRIVID